MLAKTHVAFFGSKIVAHGPLPEILEVLKARFDSDPGEVQLVYELESGKQVDFDLRGSLDEILARVVPEKTSGPGRPKLGVLSREISLLPRHWAWLETQPRGLSATLRALIEEAIEREPEESRRKRKRSALAKILMGVAGDRPHFEEVTRLLYGDFDEAALVSLTARWPKDIRRLLEAELRLAPC